MLLLPGGYYNHMNYSPANYLRNFVDHGARQGREKLVAGFGWFGSYPKEVEDMDQEQDGDDEEDGMHEELTRQGALVPGKGDGCMWHAVWKAGPRKPKWPGAASFKT